MILATYVVLEIDAQVLLRFMQDLDRRCTSYSQRTGKFSPSRETIHKSLPNFFHAPHLLPTWSHRLSQLRRMTEREAHESHRASQIMHDVESKAFAAYAKDLKHQDELLPGQSRRPSKSQPVKDQLHKVLYFVPTIVASIIEGKEKDTSRNRQTPAIWHRWLLCAPCRQDRGSAEKRKGGMFQQTQSTTGHILTAYWILSQTKKCE